MEVAAIIWHQVLHLMPRVKRNFDGNDSCVLFFRVKFNWAFYVGD